jgi:hypothetical protein
MPPKRRTPTKALRVESFICPECNHIVIPVETEGQKSLTLDTKLGQTWVLSGSERNGVPIVIPSRGYVVHKEPCHGA